MQSPSPCRNESFHRDLCRVLLQSPYRNGLALDLADSSVPSLDCTSLNSIIGKVHLIYYFLPAESRTDQPPLFLYQYCYFARSLRGVTALTRLFFSPVNLWLYDPTRLCTTSLYRSFIVLSQVHREPVTPLHTYIRYFFDRYILSTVKPLPPSDMTGLSQGHLP